GLVVLFSFNAGGHTGELRGVSLRWYDYAFNDRFAMGALQNSFVVGFWTARIALSLAPPPPPPLQPSPPRVRAIFDPLTYIAIIIPGIVIGIATLIFFVNLFGWVNPWLDYVWTAAGLGAPPVIGKGLHTVVAAHRLFTLGIVMVLARTRLAGRE